MIRLIPKISSILRLTSKTYLRRSEESLNDYESSLNDDHSEEERPQWPNVIVRPYMDVVVEEENLLHASTYPPAYRR